MIKKTCSQKMIETWIELDSNRKLPLFLPTDVDIVRETLKVLKKEFEDTGKSSFTVADLRRIRNNIYINGIS